MATCQLHALVGWPEGHGFGWILATLTFLESGAEL